MSAIREDELLDFQGEVIRANDDGYEAAARTALAIGRPDVVLRPADVTDVQRAVRFAASSDLSVAVRGGGHSAAGFGTVDRGLVIDLGALREVEMLGGNRVRVGGGARWRDVVETLAPHGLVISSGDTADVGVGGLTLSGGIGWMVRRDGLTLDHLRAVEIVTGSGEVIRADAQRHAELFWALRGGGGAFGIVTAFEFEARSGGTVHHVRLAFPAEETERVVGGWVSRMRTAPDELSSTLALADPLAGGRDAPVQLTLVASDGAAAVAASSFADLGTALSQEVERRAYADVLHEGGQLPEFLRVASRSHFVPATTAEAVAAEVARAARSEHPVPFTLHALGGAFGRVPADATAFAHRDAELLVTTFSVAPAEHIDRARAAQDGVWDRLHPLTAGAYANGLDGESARAVADIHPVGFRTRLAEVKAQYDPRGLFSRNFGPRDAVGGTLTGARRGDA